MVDEEAWLRLAEDLIKIAECLDGFQNRMAFSGQKGGTGPIGEKLAWWRCSACNALFSDLTPQAVRQAPPAQSDQHAP